MPKRTFKHEENGITFRSMLELRVAKYLWSKDVSFTYESRQLEYHTKIPGTFCGECGETPCYKKGKYTPDFFLENGVILEVKGLFDAKDRKKMAAMKELHPELDIRMVFQYNNWLTKAKKKNYGSWCDSKGIPYHVGVNIPEEWLK